MSEKQNKDILQLDSNKNYQSTRNLESSARRGNTKYYNLNFYKYMLLNYRKRRYISNSKRSSIIRNRSFH